MKGSSTASEDNMSPSEESPLAPEAPPSYDYAAALPPDDDVGVAAAGPSSSTSATATTATTSSVPKNNLHLFSGPANAEPLYANLQTSLGLLGGIETKKSGNRTETWDARLNDPQVLYDFLRHRAQARPGFKLQCTGAHLVHYDHDQTVLEDGYNVQKRKGQTDRVVDFDFFIDMSDIVNHPDNTANVHLSAIAPDLPAYRGTHSWTYSSLFAPPDDRDYYALQSDLELGSETTQPGKEVTGKLQSLWTKAYHWRVGKGLPSWINALMLDDFWETSPQGRPGRFGGLEQTVIGDLVSRTVSLRADEDEEQMNEERRELVGDVDRVRESWDQPTLKAWCEAYTAKRALLKEFKLSKEVWGWDLKGVATAVRGAIASTGYASDNITVAFYADDEELIVHPNNFLSRMIGNDFVYCLMWIFLIWPFIWAFRRYHTYGGAPFHVASAAYGLKYYPPLPSTFPAETVQAAQDRVGSLFKLHPEIPKNPTLVKGPKGVHYLLGRKEGEFFREWEERIRMAVNMRYMGELVGTRVGERESLDLDGY